MSIFRQSVADRVSALVLAEYDRQLSVARALLKRGVEAQEHVTTRALERIDGAVDDVRRQATTLTATIRGGEATRGDVARALFDRVNPAMARLDAALKAARDLRVEGALECDRVRAAYETAAERVQTDRGAVLAEVYELPSVRIAGGGRPVTLDDFERWLEARDTDLSTLVATLVDEARADAVREAAARGDALLADCRASQQALVDAMAGGNEKRAADVVVQLAPSLTALVLAVGELGMGRGGDVDRLVANTRRLLQTEVETEVAPIEGDVERDALFANYIALCDDGPPPRADELRTIAAALGVAPHAVADLSPEQLCMLLRREFAY